MTVSVNTNKHLYQGNGATTEFPFTFPLLDESHLVLYLTDPAGATTVVESGYTVGSGVVTYQPGGSPLPTGYTLALVREVPITQETDLTNSGGFHSDVLETGYDKLTMISQQLAEAVDRAVKVPLTSGATADELTQQILTAGAAATAAASTAATAANVAEQAKTDTLYLYSFSGNGNLVYFEPDGSGNLRLVPEAKWGRGLPLPLPVPTSGDGGKVIALNSGRTAFEYVTGGSGGGVTIHNDLTSRDAAGAHPISAITDLADELEKAMSASVMYTSPGSYATTVPDWANVMYVTGCGGGGGGNASHGLGGGGAMSAVKTRITVTPGETLSITVGTGGAGATSYASSPSAAPGGNGNNTVISGKLTLYGGYGGGNHPTNQWYGGAGGGAGSTAGGIRSLMAYSYGGSPASIWNGGMGGSSVFGTGGQGGYYPNNYGGITSVAGGNGSWYGAGGGGGGTDSNSNVTAGGNGSGGFLLIEYAYE